jgi:hypothetical protein
MRAPLALACLFSGLVACQQPSPAADAEKKSPPAKVEPQPQPEPERESPAPACAETFAKLRQLDSLRAGTSGIDPAAAAKLLDANALAWVREADAKLGRMTENVPDDAALLEQIQAGLAARDQSGLRSDLALIATQLRAVALLELRRQLGEVADRRLRGAEATAAWDGSKCLWESALRDLAKRADSLPERGGEGWEGDIQAAFDDGRAAIEQGDAGETVVAASKQQIEKGLYAVFHRLILADAEAKTAHDASEALGLIDAMEDRLADRNGPGLARMRKMLAGDPAQIDVAAIERELAVAFSKRARKYCDKAVVGNELATPTAVAETWEGVVYTRIILPGMRAALAERGFDADAYLEDWERYLDAVEAGDATLAGEISPRLIEWNCAYQTQLGIAECTSSTNEPG